MYVQLYIRGEKMKSLFIFTLLCSSLLSDAKHGQELYDEAKCARCHNSSDFTKKDRRSKTYKELKKSVEACRFSTNADWFDEDRDDVVHFLNKEYYKFNIK